MNFAYKNISGIWKIALAAVGILLLIHTLPFLIITGLVIFALVKCINYFKGRNKFRKNKSVNNTDSPKGKIIDVEYHDV